MAIGNNRWQRHSVRRRADQAQIDDLSLLEAVERLEAAVTNLRHLLSENAGAVAPIAAGGPVSETSMVPGMGDLARVFEFPRIVLARLIHVMIQREGQVISDADLCLLLGCSQSSLKVFVSEARGTLLDWGFRHGISRQRGVGYYMDSFEIQLLVNLCAAARQG